MVIPSFPLSGRLPWWVILPLFPLWEATLVGYSFIIPFLGGYPDGYIPYYSLSGRLSWWVYPICLPIYHPFHCWLVMLP